MCGNGDGVATAHECGGQVTNPWRRVGDARPLCDYDFQRTTVRRLLLYLFGIYLSVIVRVL